MLNEEHISLAEAKPRIQAVRVNGEVLSVVHYTPPGDPRADSLHARAIASEMCADRWGAGQLVEIGPDEYRWDVADAAAPDLIVCQ